MIRFLQQSTRRTLRHGFLFAALCVTAASADISGFKFEDLDADGVWDQPGEPGVAGWTIQLSALDSLNPLGGTLSATTVTVSDGSYLFTGVADGSYRVSEVQQPQNGWTQTFPGSGGYTLSVSGGNSFTNQNFGNTRLGSISGFKFNDANADGIPGVDSSGGSGGSQSEPHLPGWSIVLTGPGTIDTTLTDANGRFEFTHLAQGTYVVRELDQPGWRQTYPGGAGTHTVNLQGGRQLVSFGNVGTNSIRGTKFLDLDADGIRDGGEPGLSNWTIKVEPGPYYSITDANGDYNFPVLGGGLHTVTELLKPYWSQTLPAGSAAHSVTLGTNQAVTGKDFGNAIVQIVSDLSVSISAMFPSPLRAPCCGQTMTYEIAYANNGTSTATAATVKLVLYHGSAYQSSLGSPALANPVQAGNELTWTLPTLLPGASGTIRVTALMTCVLPEAPEVNSHVQILPVAGDASPADNTALYSRVANCSYDPNDKTVQPAGCGTQGLIKSTDSLTYKVRFQNLGNAPAYHVVVRDTLDTDLDIATLTSLGTSHPATLEISGRELKWTFWDIVLPAAMHDEPGSHGFIDFKVKQLPGNPAGTVIENDASIYFDLNSAVVTNTTVNTVTANPMPVATFTHSPACSGGGCNYNFTYTGGSAGATFLWDFGQGATPGTSTDQNPVGITYASAGRKVPTLKVALGTCQIGPAYALIDAETKPIAIQNASASDAARFGMMANGTLWYSLENATSVEAKLFDMHGREVSRLFNGWAPAGRHTARLQTARLNPGTYMLVIQTGDGYRQNLKVVLTAP
jgi:fimbrial isopeptide formation D2 family protein/uncharacterized repeat protein (TIGR01451 family)